MKIITIITLLFQQLFNFSSFTPSQKLPSSRFSFMPNNEQIEFVKDITKYIQNNHPDFTMDFSQGRILSSDGTEYGLDNLAQQYHQASVKERKSLISNHFAGILKTKQEEKELLKNLGNFEKIKEHLTIRLFPIDYASLNKEDMLIFQNDLDGTLTVLVFDLPSSVINVKPEQAKLWGKSNEELFEIGLKNTLANYQITINEQKLSDGTVLWLLSENHIYVTSQVFNLKNHPNLIGKYGSLVVVPHRHAVVIYPIQDLSVVKTINAMIAVAMGMYKDGPGSITPNLFWYHDGVFTNVLFNIDGKKVGITPPEEFIQILNKLTDKK